MALTPSGAISMADLNTALGRTSTAAISFNDSQVRFIGSQDSGAVNMNSLRNKYTFNGTMTADTAAVYPPGETRTGVYDVPVTATLQGTISGNNIWDTYGLIYVASNVVAGYTITKLTAFFPEAPDYPNLSMRLKVGTNSTASMSKTSIYLYSSSDIAITGSDVGVSRTWQFAQA